jgi:predicted nucleic acid-binding protein
LVDSNIWHFAYIVPEKEEFKGIHRQASEFLENLLIDSKVKIGISQYQIAEIMDLLRKGNLSRVLRQKVFDGFGPPKFKIVPVTMSILKAAFRKSLESGIHIYDYLVAFPLKAEIDVIFSSDDHFQHPDFQAIAPVTNPLAPWILREGKLPLRAE